MKAFMLVNILIDLEPAFVIYLGLDYPLHGPTHTLAGTTGIALLVGMLCCFYRTRKQVVAGWFGALFGAWSHLFLDALVHSDVRPFWPFLDGNSLYRGWMEPLSVVCLIVTLGYLVPWLLVQVRHILKRPGTTVKLGRPSDGR